MIDRCHRGSGYNARTRFALSGTDQVHKTRAVAVGGILKRYIREQGREDLTQEPGEEKPQEKAEQVFFG